MKLTRHNGRSGKNGTYNPRHNARRFNVENSEHIDAERARKNIYWDCYRGFTTVQSREDAEQPDYSFEEIEKRYYAEHYGEHVDAQNARNEKNRHTKRNRTVEDLLKNNKTCPEESIYQIGTLGESVPPDVLLGVAHDFYVEFDRRFGSHIYILDWALHLDEGTASCIYTQKENKKIRKPQAADQTAFIFARLAAARLFSINSIRRLCWS